MEYKNGEPVDIPDSLRAVFYTENGRPVLDGGGIVPDVALDPIKKGGFLKGMDKQHIIFNYANTFALDHDSIGPIEDFSFVAYDEFKEFAKENGFEYTTPTEKELEDLVVKIDADGLESSLKTEISEIRAKIEETKQDDYEEYKKTLIPMIEKEIVARYYYQKGKIIQQLKNDEEVSAAIALLRDPARYRSILETK